MPKDLRQLGREDFRGRVRSVATLADLPDPETEDLGTRYFVESQNQSYEVTGDE